MLRFALAGIPISTPSPGGTIEGLKRAAELGIAAMELEWVQRVPSNVEHVEEIGRVAHELQITLTVHAPYYVNLNARDPATLEASKKRILSALAMAQVCGAVSVCVHPAFYLGMAPEKVLNNVRGTLEDILERREFLFPSVNLALETMGKPTQFGALEEVLGLSKEFGLYPCLDPAHLHARTNGGINSKGEWEEMFRLYASYLGKTSLQNMHLHYSGIAYGPKGERRHLPLKESDAKWEDFLAILKQRQIGGVCVCESPLLEEDTLLLQRAYREVGSVA
jgi:deoxyribonuclease-4